MISTCHPDLHGSPATRAHDAPPSRKVGPPESARDVAATTPPTPISSAHQRAS